MEDENELPIGAKGGASAGAAKDEEGPGGPGVAPRAPSPASTGVAELTTAIQELRADHRQLYDRLIRKQAEARELA